MPRSLCVQSGRCAFVNQEVCAATEASSVWGFICKVTSHRVKYRPFRVHTAAYTINVYNSYVHSPGSGPQLVREPHSEVSRQHLLYTGRKDNRAPKKSVDCVKLWWLFCAGFITVLLRTLWAQFGGPRLRSLMFSELCALQLPTIKRMAQACTGQNSKLRFHACCLLQYTRPRQPETAWDGVALLLAAAYSGARVRER